MRAETVVAFDRKAGIDVDEFLAFADRVRELAGAPKDLGDGTQAVSLGGVRGGVVRVESGPRPAPRRVTLTGHVSMGGRLRSLTARLEEA